MIEVSGLTKRYGNKTAVNNATFTIKEGEIVGFLGPNGAGKSTTMNILTGFISATEGNAKVCGIDISEEPLRAKQKIGYLPEHPPLYFDMTATEQLEFTCDLRKIPKGEWKAEIDRVCGLVKITDVKHRLIKNLSKGYKQRVGLAQALIGSPEVLILDEPTVGLDPKQIIDIRNMIKDLGKNHTIVLSSHILPEISAICERVLVISEGTLVADDTPENLASKVSGKRLLSLRICGPKDDVLKAIREIPGVKFCDVQGKKEEGSLDYIVEAQTSVDIRKPLFNKLAEKNFPILQMTPSDVSLEDIFLQLTNKEEHEKVEEL